MPASLRQQIEDRLSELDYGYHHLLLVIVPISTGKKRDFKQVATQAGLAYVNLGLELSQRFIELTDRQRSLRVPRLMDEILNGKATAIFLDNTEILFDINLQQDPLRLLQNVSRNHTIVASWCGKVQGENLVYAEPGHPEYRRCPIKDLHLINLD
jgi:hypothetical protein